MVMNQQMSLLGSCSLVVLVVEVGAAAVCATLVVPVVVDVVTSIVGSVDFVVGCSAGAALDPQLIVPVSDKIAGLL